MKKHYIYFLAEINIKGLLFILFFLALVFNGNIVYSQTGTFNFTGASDNGNNITQTVDSRTLTVTTASGNIGLYDGNNEVGLSLTTNSPPQCYDEVGTTSMTLTFSGTVNITTIYCMEGTGNNFNWDFTPTGGSNSAKTNQAINGLNGTEVTLNFVGITAITITRTGGGGVLFGVDNIVMDAALPVELTTFTAHPAKNTVQLKWATATEVNNYGFEVERSAVGNQQSGWEKIAFVNGHGNSNSPKEYSFVDLSPLPGLSSYRLKQIDFDGANEYYDAVTVSLSASSQPELMQNNPNPFNPSTAIKFYIPENNIVSIKIYDMLGREITTLVNKATDAGYHIIYWNGKDDAGKEVSSGVYLYKLTAGNFSETKKMNLLK